MDVITGETRLWRCRRDRCAWCGSINAANVVLAVALANPERLVTLTKVGDDWQTIRGRMRRLVYDVRSEGRRVEWAWAVESNPRGTGHHVHALQHGDFIPQGMLSRLADYRGLGRVADVRRVSMLDRAARYPLKSLAATAYSLKGTADLEQHLALNGGRMLHTSRRFWRDENGRPVARKRDAVGLALAARYGQQTASWVLCRENEVAAMVASAGPPLRAKPGGVPRRSPALVAGGGQTR